MANEDLKNEIDYAGKKTLDYTIAKLSKVLSAGGSLDFPLTLEQGGTNATTADEAWENLGGGDVGKLDTNGTATQYLDGSGNWSTPKDTTYEVATSAGPGLMPALSATATHYLNGSGEWSVVDNVANAAKAASADKLTTGHTITVQNGSAAAATSAAFDGTSNVTINLSNLDASTLTTGTIPLARIPQGALERIVDVADQAARFALTTAKVQLGDTVRQLDTGVMYVVVDEGKLNQAAGYVEYAAGTALEAEHAKTADSATSANTATSATSATSATTANSAAKLTSPRSLKTKLDSTTAVTFDGSGDQNAIPVTGTLGVENGGTGKTTAAEAWTNLGGGSVGKMNLGTDTTKYLRNDGQWVAPPNTNTWNAFKGASSTAAGTVGYVSPAPQAGDQNKFFRADGTWQIPTNTDTNVKQDVSSANTAYPILLKNGTGTGSVTTTALFDEAVTINPSTNTITATTFAGALSGNATTATTAGNVSGTVGIDHGGTGATTKDAAWTALGGGNVGKLSYSTDTTKYLRNDGTWQVPPNTNTWNAFKGASSTAAGTVGYVSPAPAAGDQNKFFRADGTWQIPTNTTYGVFGKSTSSAAGSQGLVPAPGAGADNRYLRNDGTWQVPPDNNTTYGVVSTSANGLAPKLTGSTTVYLNGNGAWTTPPNTTYGVFGKSTSSAAGSNGLVPAPAAGSDNRYLRNDGTWQVPPNTNTDTNVTQNHSTGNAEYPILLKNGTGTGNVTSTSIFDGDVTINPSNGIVTALGFKGPLTGNASTATTLQNSRNLAVALGTANANGVGFNGGANQLAIPVTGTLAIGNGGTGATSRANALYNLQFMGSNPTGGTANDTMDKWKALGNGWATINALDQLNGQPGQYGFLINRVSGSEVHQEFWQQNNGAHYWRGGNGSTTAMPSWRTALDSSNYTSYTVTKTGSGASGSWGINVTGSSASCTGNAATASKLGTSTVGGTAFPIYLNGGTATKCTDMGTVYVGTSAPTDSNYKLWIDTSS